MESTIIFLPIALALFGLAYMSFKKFWVMKQDAGDGKMKEISDHIYEGALAFLNAEYRLLSLSLIHISEPTRLLSISYAVFCLKKKNKRKEMLY